MKQHFVVLLILILSACVSPQQSHVEEQQRVREFQQRTAAFAADFRATIAADRRLDPIRSKVALADGREASLAMMALTNKPTDDEKAAIEIWHQFVRDLRQKYSAVYQQHIPWFVPIYEAGAAAGFSLVADLYTGKLAYGDYNRQRVEVINRVLQAARDREEELRRQQLATAQIQAQTALSSLQTYLMSQQLLNQQLMPARIAPFTCARFGNITNCY